MLPDVSADEVKARRAAASSRLVQAHQRSIAATRSTPGSRLTPPEPARTTQRTRITEPNSRRFGHEDFEDLSRSRWLFFGECQCAIPGQRADALWSQRKMVALQAEAQAHFAILLAEICPKTAPPLRVYCTFDHITGRGPTGALAEFSSIAAAEKALAACRMANAGNHKPPKILWRQCGFAELPSFTKANSRGYGRDMQRPGMRVDQVVQEGVQPSRLAQLRRGQKVASVAAFAASLLGLAHLVLYVFTPGSRPSWLGRSRRHGVEARVALSGFLSAHPLEFPGLLLASSAVTGACEAAAQVNCGRNYRSLYISLAIAGLCYIFDESAVAQQIRAVASTGTTGALFIVAYVVYSCLDWLSNGISISEVFLGVRATRKLGLPQPWKAAEPNGVRLLPKLYAIAEGSVFNPHASSDSTWVLEPAPTEQQVGHTVHLEVPELQRQVGWLELQLRQPEILKSRASQESWMFPVAIRSQLLGRETCAEVLHLPARLTKNGKYGLKLAKRGDHLWRIIEIMPEGTVHEHNEANPQETLRENDLILKINGEDADIRILETAEDGAQVEVTVLRMPRSVAPPPYAFGVKPACPPCGALAAYFPCSQLWTSFAQISSRISSRPEQLSSPEAAQLNKGVGFWAWSALLEAALLGVLCSSWARHLGYSGPGVAFSGLATAALAAAPACVVLAASFMGWSRSESALVELTRARPQQPWERLGRYDLEKLEGLYLDGITKYYSEFYDRCTTHFSVLLKQVRLEKAGSKVLRYCRADIQKLVCQAQALDSILPSVLAKLLKLLLCHAKVVEETQESVVPVNDVEEKPPATRVAAEEQVGKLDAPVLRTRTRSSIAVGSPESKAESEPMAPSPVVEVQAVVEDVETNPATKEITEPPETQKEAEEAEPPNSEQPKVEQREEEPNDEEFKDESKMESKEQYEAEAKKDKESEGRIS
ncbi:unnamed protein product [Symbiodinium microadriaticum]|nr:unnamed protein product [Symbiodinium microadriaticum]